MPSLKAIRKRISSVKSTQKITRAMKMVAGARLNKAQQRITELRPYAIKTQGVLAEITKKRAETGSDETASDTPAHPLLTERAEKRVLLLVMTSDRGLCGGFNSNINKRAEREAKERMAAGQDVKIAVIGRKGRDYLKRRHLPVWKVLPGVWDKLGLETAQRVGQEILKPFLEDEVDSLYLVYNEFKSAMSQNVVVERLLPVAPLAEAATGEALEFTYEPTRDALLEVLAPMYVDISILRALYESMASELGSRMTAMDSATKNASEMISSLTLQFNKARQASITKELMEIVGGSEALKD